MANEVWTLPNGEKVEYEPEGHKYFVNGKEIPSVTTALKVFYGDTYSAVNKTLLNASAEYGTNVHEELDRYIKTLKTAPDTPIVSDYEEVRNFFKYVMPRYKLEPLYGEKVIVVYDSKGAPLMAGRFDLMCKINGELTLADFKTTSSIHRQLVTAQLNLYAIGAFQCKYITQEEYDNLKLAAIHLKKDINKLLPITKLSDNFYLQFDF